MKWIRWFVGAAVLAACGLSPLRAVAVQAGQIDTFENGTTLGWSVGASSPLPPMNISAGGPMGAGDHYLLLQSNGGNGPGSKLTVFNTAQWTGNYLSAGISTISMDVNNLGSTPLALRLMFDGSSATAISANAVTVPAGSGWMAISFPLDAGNLTALSGNSNAALSDVTKLWLYHDLLPDEGVDEAASVVAQLGVDNIRASSTVPAPSSLMTLGLGAGIWVSGRRLRRVK